MAHTIAPCYLILAIVRSNTFNHSRDWVSSAPGRVQIDQPSPIRRIFAPERAPDSPKPGLVWRNNIICTANVLRPPSDQPKFSARNRCRSLKKYKFDPRRKFGCGLRRFGIQSAQKNDVDRVLRPRQLIASGPPRL